MTKFVRKYYSTITFSFRPMPTKDLVEQEELAQGMMNIIVRMITVNTYTLRRDDTFGAKLQERKTCMPFVYCHSMDIIDRPNIVYFCRVFL